MVRGRREGKTTETIKWLLRAPKDNHDRPRRVLLCVDERRAQFVLNEYPALKGFVFSLPNWQCGRGRGSDVEVALDDAESFLYRAVGQDITRITISGVPV